ncbi:MAG: hypothetical protein KC619_32155, partial [Myxococcales bacterium]|nr:hypothetical protein [Myxococcales bacterium]
LSAALERAAEHPESLSLAVVGSLILWVVAGLGSSFLQRRFPSVRPFAVATSPRELDVDRHGEG